MASTIVPRKSYFPRVREAREALKEKALELHELHMKIIQAALDKGNLEVAAEEVKWMRSHMPPDEDGTTAIGIDIDKVKAAEGPKGPQITIGFTLGGFSKPPELPAANQAESTVPDVTVIDVTPTIPHE